MSGTDQSCDVCRCAGDVAAYALGALDSGEAKSFGAHLDTCAVCRDELAGLHGVVDALPLSVPQHRVPRDLRRRVIEAVRDDQQPARNTRLRRAVPRPAAGSPRRRALALSAAVAASGIVVAVVVRGASERPDTRVYAAEVTGRGSGEVRFTGNQAELIVRHLSPLPAGQIYEVWLGRPGRPPAPTGTLFDVTARGDGDVGVSGDMRGVTELMVTREPDGGSPVPTHPPVIHVQLS